MKLHEFINTTLTDHNGLFKTKMFQDGLHRYQDRYRQNRQDVETWKADPQEKPTPAPLLLGNTHTDPKNASAMMAAMLAVLHNEYIRDDVPLLGDWPGDVRDFLQNNVLPRFRKYGTSDISDEWGLVLSNMVRRAVHTLQHTDESPDWNDLAYIPNSEAVKLAEGKITLDRLSKILKSGKHDLRYIQNENQSRCKVHIEDLRKFLKRLDAEPDFFSDAAFGAMAQYQADAEKTKKTIIQEKINRR